MSLKIKEEYLTELLKSIEEFKIGFDTEGCACGKIEFKLNEDLYLSVYRSCRKSSMTPDDKLWHIEEIEFYSKPYDEFDYPEEPSPINIRLNKEQEELILKKLKDVSVEIWGHEFRSEY